MSKAHSKVTHIKQQKYFHHLKGRGYNKKSVLYPGRLKWWKYFCCFICVTLLWALHIVIKQQFFYIFLINKYRIGLKLVIQLQLWEIESHLRFVCTNMPWILLSEICRSVGICWADSCADCHIGNLIQYDDDVCVVFRGGVFNSDNATRRNSRIWNGRAPCRSHGDYCS